MTRRRAPRSALRLVKALDQHRVGATEKSELLGILSPMKGDIVGQ